MIRAGSYRQHKTKDFAGHRHHGESPGTTPHYPQTLEDPFTECSETAAIGALFTSWWCFNYRRDTVVVGSSSYRNVLFIILDNNTQQYTIKF